MDRDWGSKPGSAGAASEQNEAMYRRERLRRLALETIDLTMDRYFVFTPNHLDSYECKVCLTLHNNEGNYLTHTQGKRHQTNLAKRAAREAMDGPTLPQPQLAVHCPANASTAPGIPPRPLPPVQELPPRPLPPPAAPPPPAHVMNNLPRAPFPPTRASQPPLPPPTANRRPEVQALRPPPPPSSNLGQ